MDDKLGSFVLDVFTGYHPNIDQLEKYKYKNYQFKMKCSEVR